MTTSLGQTVFMNALTPVRVASNSNIVGTYYNGSTNNGVGATLTIAASSLAIGSVTVAVGDRILLPNQSTPAQNGIYIVRSIDTAVTLLRAFDQKNIEQLKAGEFAVVGAGDNAGAIFALVEPIPQTIGTDAFNYVATGDMIASVPITAAQFNAMYTTPVQLVDAPGANKLIVVDRMELVLTYGSAAYAVGGVVSAQYDATANGAGVKATNTEAAADFFVTASNTFLFNGAIGAAPFTTSVNKGLYLSNATGVFTTGNSPVVAKVHYHVITVA